MRKHNKQVCLLKTLHVAYIKETKEPFPVPLLWRPIKLDCVRDVNRVVCVTMHRLQSDERFPPNNPTTFPQHN